MNKLANLENNSSNETVKFTLDKYSKTVLSIIALCLTLITANLYLKPGELGAYETVQDVNIKSINGSSLWGSEIPVNLKQINGSSFSGSEIPVDLQSMKGRDLWDDKLPVDIRSINGISIFGSDMPVKIR